MERLASCTTGKITGATDRTTRFVVIGFDSEIQRSSVKVTQFAVCTPDGTIGWRTDGRRTRNRLRWQPVKRVGSERPCLAATFTNLTLL